MSSSPLIHTFSLRQNRYNPTFASHLELSLTNSFGTSKGSRSVAKEQTADVQPEAANDGDEAKPGRLRRFAVATGRIIAMGYATVLVMLVVMESRLVYPGAYMDISPTNPDGVQSVDYQSADGTKLVGRLYEQPDAEHTVLYFHGNGITAGRESQTIANLGALFNANVMAAEYRGFDSLEGTPNETDVIADSMAARDYLVDRFSVKPDQLVLYGQSLGGGCAVAVASDSGAKLLVLDRTFDKMVDVAQGMYWFVPVKYLMRNRFDSVARIQNYTGPLVQLHGNADQLIPIKHGKHLHDSAPSKVKHWIVADGMGHNDATPSEAWDEVRVRIREVLAE